MKAEIEQIIRADDAAAEAVEKAREEAARIRGNAGREADDIAASGRDELAVAVEAQVRAILSEAESKAQKMRAEADAYLLQLRARQQRVREDLIEALLKKVTGT